MQGAMVDDSVFDCTVELRELPIRRKNSVRIGCGAGFAGDRPSAAEKLLRRVPNLDYLVLECLAERTFAERVEAKAACGKGYDPRISEWMTVLLPVAVRQRVCIITNMGGVDPLAAQDELVKLSAYLGINASIAVAFEHPLSVDGTSTYLGAAPIVHALQTGKPHVLITSRLADASLFLGPMVHELGWNWNDYPLLAQGALAGHLLECGCQLTGGYYVHPADRLRGLPIAELLAISLPYADVFWDGKVIVAKAEGSGGEISVATCTEQLLYEVEDPSSYITPDVILDLRKVAFQQLSKDEVLVTGSQAHANGFPEFLLQLVPSFCGWKGWGEISYGGLCCEERANISDQLVRSWMEETYPGSGHRILSYMIGKNSLHTSDRDSAAACKEVRLRLDGLFDSQEEAARFVQEFGALYTNGPAGGGGVSSGCKKEIKLNKEMVSRDKVFWKVQFTGVPDSTAVKEAPEAELRGSSELGGLIRADRAPAPAGVYSSLHRVAHSRTGDKGDTLNVSLIPHCSEDISRLQQVITVDWVRNVFSSALIGRSNSSSSSADLLPVSIHLVEGVSALNIVVKNALDGGVTCSRRIDRHGKTLSDLILAQQICLP